jgi:hypothetical protein
MSKSNVTVNNNTSGGIGFSGLLTLVFIVLKLTGFINWSWWWVLSPLWISFSIFLIVVLILMIVAVLTYKSPFSW